jgi:hypothetical protein
MKRRRVVVDGRVRARFAEGVRALRDRDTQAGDKEHERDRQGWGDPHPNSLPRSTAACGLSTLIKNHLAGGASRLAALLLPQILPVFSVVAPCHPGAALRDLVLVQRGQATRGSLSESPRQV